MFFSFFTRLIWNPQRVPSFRAEMLARRSRFEGRLGFDRRVDYP